MSPCNSAERQRLAAAETNAWNKEAQGMVVQVDPIKPIFKLPGTKRLTLECDEPLSKYAFKFKLRRYTKGAPTTPHQPYFTYVSADGIDIRVGRRSEVGTADVLLLLLFLLLLLLLLLTHHVIVGRHLF